MVKRCVYILFVVLLLNPATHALSQKSTQTDTTGAPISVGGDAYHFSARSSSIRDIDGERVLELRGGVTITHGDVVITSDRGRQYTQRRLTLLLGDVTIDQNELHMQSDEGRYFRSEDRATLSRNVKIVDRGWTIHCDEAVFFRKTDEVRLSGNVVVIDSATTLTADSLFYNKRDLYAEAFGNVTISNRDEGIKIAGRHGFYYRDRGEGVMDVLPHLVIDPESPEPVVVDSDTMRFYPDDDRAVANGRVKIIKGNTVTQCDSAVVIDRENRAELYGNPLAKKENSSMQGEKMILHYNDDEIHQIQIIGQAILKETPRDTLIVGRDSWIQGDSMTLYLGDNRLDSLRVAGNAVSRYYPGSTNKVESNYAVGDSMLFTFRNDSLSYVKMIGKANGIYRYLDLKKKETADSLRAVLDTSLVYVPFAQKSQRVVYSADTIQYYAQKRDLVLKENSTVVYGKRTLFGKNITYNADLQLLDARGTPVLIEGADKFYGQEMDYDLESGIGLVQDGSTKFMEGYYKGEEVAKVGDNVLKVWNSTYTTCDRKVPHYHFASNQMKVYLDDKVVSGPIALYIGDTPIAILPFFAQNIRRGRRSGMLRPDFEFGINSREGRFVRNIGYYWATNDYTDFNFVGDFNENSSLRMAIDNRYKVRYLFNGGVRYQFLRDLNDFSTKWTLASNHNQTLGEKFTFTSDLSFISSDDAPRAVSRIDDVEDVIDRQIKSRVSLRKSWSTVGFSASATRDQILNVTDPDVIKVKTTLPSVVLSIPSRTLYFGDKSRSGREGFFEKVLDGIRYSPALSFNRRTDERLTRYTETITSNQSLSFSSTAKVGIISFTPGISGSNQFTRTVTETDAQTINNSVDIDGITNDIPVFIPESREKVTDNEFNWSTGVGARTNFYGTFYPNIGKLVGLRHSVAPSAQYTFRPSIDGRPSSQNVSFNLRNALDLKIKDGDNERKLPGVALWSLSTAYNPRGANGRLWSNVSSVFNVRLFGTGVSVTQSIDPYELEVLNTNVTSSLSFRGTHGFGTAGEAAAAELNVVAASDTGDAAYTIDDGGASDPERDDSDGLPWNVGMSFSYFDSKTSDPRATLNPHGELTMTRSWRFSYRAQYDLQERDLRGQWYSISRDLHCWEMSFTRQQLGDVWEFYFRISVGAHPEIYAEQGERGLGAGSIGSAFGY